MERKKISLCIHGIFIFCLIAVSSCDNQIVLEPNIEVVATTAAPGTDDLSGRVNDPETGSPRSGVSVTITITASGGGTYQANTSTDSNGDYSFSSVPDGTGTVQVVHDGNISTINIDTTVTNDTTNVDFSPPDASYAADRYIIALTWAADPRDLDSHLWVPNGTPTHVYYGNKGDNVGILDIDPFAGLDVDDTNGEGPETITIKITNSSAHYSGNYRYWVYKYSGTGDLSVSAAKVSVYKDGTLVKTYDVPTSGSDRFWHVFDLNGNTITDVNTLQGSAPSAP